MASPPTGTLTFLFTDIEGSTKLWERDPTAMSEALARHDEILAGAIAANECYVFKTVGDAVMAVLRRPASALQAVLDAQRRLVAPPGGGQPFDLKAGMHHGPCIAVTMNDRLDYFGSVVNVATRLERFSSGEDVIVYDAVRHDPEVEELLSAPENQLSPEPFEAQ